MAAPIADAGLVAVAERLAADIANRDQHSMATVSTSNGTRR
jgi:hypothetical protein